MIDVKHDLPLTRQAALLNISRGSIYYKAKGRSQLDLRLMRDVDRLHTEYPFMGARMLRDKLALQGDRIGRRHVARLMRVMGIEALYAQKSTSRRHPQHFVFPYLLRDITIAQPNHVWFADITYIPMERGFLYLFAVMDRATRRILAWRLLNSLTTDFCIDAVEEAIEQYGSPEIFNTDQGVQFTSSDFVQIIREKHGIALSMDGKSCWRDNVMIEGSGDRSNTKKSICMRTMAPRPRNPASGNTSRFITAHGRIRLSTAKHPTRYTSPKRRRKSRRNPQSHSL